MSTKPTFVDVVSSFTEEDKERFRRRQLEHLPYEGQEITFFFPKKFNLQPVDVKGFVTRVGDLVYISTWVMNKALIDEDCEYSNHRRWRVKSVDWSMRVPANLKGRLLDRISYRTEIHLVHQDYSVFLRLWWKVGNWKWRVWRWWKKGKKS